MFKCLQTLSRDNVTYFTENQTYSASRNVVNGEWNYVFDQDDQSNIHTVDKSGDNWAQYFEPVI